MAYYRNPGFGPRSQDPKSHRESRLWAGVLVNHEAKLKGGCEGDDYTQKPGLMDISLSNPTS